MAGICASICAAQNAEQHEPGPRAAAHRRDRGEQRQVVEGPAPDGRQHGAAASAARRVPRIRSRSRTSRAGSWRSGSAFGRTRLRDALDDAADPAAAGRRGRAAASRRVARTTKRPSPSALTSSRSWSTEPRRSAGMREHGHGEDDGEGEQPVAVRPDTAAGPPHAGGGRACGTGARRRSRRRRARPWRARSPRAATSRSGTSPWAWIARRWSTHRQASAAAWATTIAASQPGAIRSRSS